jgi:hypothetical protein
LVKQLAAEVLQAARQSLYAVQANDCAHVPTAWQQLAAMHESHFALFQVNVLQAAGHAQMAPSAEPLSRPGLRLAAGRPSASRPPAPPSGFIPGGRRGDDAAEASSLVHFLSTQRLPGKHSSSVRQGCPGWALNPREET